MTENNKQNKTEKKSMGKAMVIVLIAVGVLLIAAVIIFLRIRHIQEYEVMDGPGMVYTWTDYQLHGSWTEVGDGDEKTRLFIDESSIELTSSYGSETIKYRLPEGTIEEGSPDGEVNLILEDSSMFESLIFHEETGPDGNFIPVLSGTIFEYDGRGEIVIAEFVRDEDIYLIPEGFESSVMKVRNSWEGVPDTFMEVAEEETETETEDARETYTKKETYTYVISPSAYDAENRVMAWKIKVTDPVEQVIIEEIDPESIYYPEDGTEMVFEEDVDFDGAKDIVIYKGTVGAQGVGFYDCYLYRVGKFVYCTGFDSIPEPMTDENEKILYGNIRDGAERYYRMEYEIHDTEAVKMKEILFEYDEDAQDYIPRSEE